MFITNSESLNPKQIFYCKSKNLQKFLCEHKGMCYISSTYDEVERKYKWLFVKSKELDSALKEWTQNKVDGNLLFPKEDIVSE